MAAVDEQKTVAAHGLLSDPDYEPSDDDLAGLMTRAFSDVANMQLEAHQRIRERIADARRKLLQEIARTNSR